VDIHGITKENLTIIPLAPCVKPLYQLNQKRNKKGYSKKKENTKLGEKMKVGTSEPLSKESLPSLSHKESAFKDINLTNKRQKTANKQNNNIIYDKWWEGC
jgi:hypothetical protein